VESSELRGTSLRIYLHLLESDSPKGIRELSRELGLPVSTVHYHVRKLRELGLVREVPEGLVVSRRVRLEGFVYLGRRVVPRLAFYSAFFTGVLLGLVGITLTSGDLNPDRVVALVVSAVATAVTALEAYYVRRSLLS
jgi:DNA-binding Lrp family transcriptional regulator